MWNCFSPIVGKFLASSLTNRERWNYVLIPTHIKSNTFFKTAADAAGQCYLSSSTYMASVFVIIKERVGPPPILLPGHRQLWHYWDLNPQSLDERELTLFFFGNWWRKKKSSNFTQCKVRFLDCLKVRLLVPHLLSPKQIVFYVNH